MFVSFRYVAWEKITKKHARSAETKRNINS